MRARVLTILLLVLWPLGTRAERRPPAREPHLHGSAAVKGGRLLNLARRAGDLSAGLSALGLGHLPEKQALGAARRRMDLSQPDHDRAYEAIKQFRRAAFAGEHYGAWVRAAVKGMRKNARRTLVQLSASEVDRFVATAAAEHLDLDGIDLLMSVRRDKLAAPGDLAGTLRTNARVVGLDVVGAETGDHDPAALNQALDVLLASGRRRTVLRVHAGEGFLGAHGHDNVNLVLGTLVERSARTDLSGVRVILAHVARVRDPKAAARDLLALKRRGVRVEVNVNPLSNLMYRAVDRLEDIAALRLGVPLVPGSDNVGTLAQNARILRLLVRGEGARAADLARHVVGLRDRWRAAGAP